MIGKCAKIGVKIGREEGEFGKGGWENFEKKNANVTNAIPN